MKNLKKIIKYLKGKKTYLSCVLLAVYSVSKAFGFIVTLDQDLAILTLIGALMGASIRNSIN